DPSRSPLFESVFIVQRPHRAGAGESGAQSMSPLEVFLLARPGLGFEVEGLTLEHFEFEHRVARFDLVLFLIETSGLLSGLLQYNKELFERATAERLCAGFENLLRGIVARPEARLTTFETRSQNVEERRSPESQAAKESKLGRLKGARRRAVDLSEVSVVTAEPLREGELLPLVLRPAAEHVVPSAWARANRDLVESHLLRHGAILFRGFDLSAASEFERLAESLCDDLFHEYADLPREEVGGKVYGSTPYPADQAILFHNESSHMHCWPLKIWFFCETAAETGGETPVADCRRIYREMRPELREPFERKGLLYVRNFVEGFDVRWQDFFRTNDRAAVEARCRHTGMEAEWLEGGHLRVRKLCPAVADHPKTGERVFFNQMQAHHVSCLDPAVRRSMLSLFGEENLPRNVYYGDGSVIEDGVMDAVREVYGAAAVAFPWREGDVLMLDNMLTAHGRNPYTGRRKILVTMGEMIPGQAPQQ
ncbi:MAG: TauD/TfdA family dioxygenase, partial [Acidobacteria bacterium]|nr:TauD/TfdA family dioxygenase [Acidobacteriota bacterium]